jgi:putative SOS response-associated peptidase YedK
MKPIHERMPVIIPADHHDEWLDQATEGKDQLLDMLRPYPAREMEAYPVSKHVNSPRNNSPECIKKLGRMNRPLMGAYE